jgi:hypothetical protein
MKDVVREPLPKVKVMSQPNTARVSQPSQPRIFQPLPSGSLESAEGASVTVGRFSWPAMIEALRYGDSATVHAFLRAESGFQSCLGNKSAKRVGAYLRSQQAIKVIVNKGGGFGHQHAAVTGMRRLRELGFGGTFLVSCASEGENVKERLQFLARPHPNLHIDYLSYRDVIAQKTELGFCFAGDLMRQSSFALDKTYNVDHFVLLNPTDWPGMPWMGIANEIDGRNRYLNTVSKILAEGVLDCRSHPVADETAHRAAVVEGLIAGRREKYWHLVPIYGLRDWPTRARQSMLRRPTQIGLTAAQELAVLALALSGRDPAARPVIVPVLDRIAPDVLQELEKYPRVKVVRDVAGLAVSARESGAVIFFDMPVLTPDQFDKLVMQADLYVAEGANSVSFAKKEGIPFVRGGRAYLDALSDQSMPESIPEGAAYRNAGIALQHAFVENIPDEPDLIGGRLKASLLTLEKRGDYVRKLVELCLAGKTGDFYRTASGKFKARPDKIYAAVLLILADRYAAPRQEVLSLYTKSI